MNVSPTTRSYLISFAAGLVVTAVGIVADQFAQHPDGAIDWRALGFAVVGGLALFARDWAKNNMGAFLEGVAPDQVQSAVAQKGSTVLVPPAANLPPTNPPVA